MSDSNDELQRAFNEDLQHAKPWIEALVGEVAECTDGYHGPLSWRVAGHMSREWHDPDTEPVPDKFYVSHWDLYVYEGLIEVMGGADDGAVETTGLTMNLSDVASLLDNNGKNTVVIEVSSSPAYRVFDCDVVSMCGVYEGNSLTLHILLGTPSDEKAPAGRLYQDGRIVEILDNDDESKDD